MVPAVCPLRSWAGPADLGGCGSASRGHGPGRPVFSLVCLLDGKPQVRIHLWGRGQRGSLFLLGPRHDRKPVFSEEQPEQQQQLSSHGDGTTPAEQRSPQRSLQRSWVVPPAENVKGMFQLNGTHSLRAAVVCSLHLIGSPFFVFCSPV